ncbi:MAG: thiamine pyrophosphate-dependent dehydrogenase E1 component subunit alpha [Azospirillum sp.]|nr:thiamine pyrophosphate-dependent dehydrogenase E1 component subunit alpha [Azospirillum sp.]
MLRIRNVELAIAARYPEQRMRCPVHLSVGQEAVAVGVCENLKARDKAVSTHRCHAHYLAKGGRLAPMLAEIYGKATGCCGGRGGSMHLFDDDVGMLLSLPIVASSIPIGVGAGLAFAQRAEPGIAVVFLGDASLEEGVWHESANFAARHRLPVLFVCENNLFSVYTHLKDRQPDRPLTRLAEAHAIPARQIDGNDVEAVAAAAAKFVRAARAGEGPGFLQVDTYRWLEHCGPNYDNDIGYRTEAEYLEWRAKCPVETYARRLRETGALTPAFEAECEAGIHAEIDAAFRFAEDSPFPDSRDAAEGVYA